MSDVDDLVAWLTGALAHLEAVAVAASPSDSTTWTARDHEADSKMVSDHGDTVVYDEGSPTDEQAAHMALHDPRAILARVAAERMILNSVLAIPMSDSIAYELAWGHRFDYPGYRHEWTSTVFS